MPSVVIRAISGACEGNPSGFGNGSSRAGVLPGVQEPLQVVFVHSALLCGALEVIGAVIGACSPMPCDARPRPPLESEITVVVCPHHLQTTQESTLSHLAHAGGAAQAVPSCGVLRNDRDQACGRCPERLAVAAPAGRVCSQGSESNNR